MVSYRLLFSRRAVKDKEKIVRAGLKEKVQGLLDILREDPWQVPPPYEKLVGDLQGFCSRRINRQHRLVYQVLEETKIIKVLCLWTHYE